MLDEHFGPPGFGEDPKTDPIELIPVLVLDAPVSVEGDSGDLMFNESNWCEGPTVDRFRHTSACMWWFLGHCMGDTPRIITRMS